MTAIIWATCLVVTVAVTMFGVYMCARIADDNASKLRRATEDLKAATEENFTLSQTVAALRLQLQTERNRIHQADERP